MGKSNTENINNTDLNIVPLVINPDIADQLIQAFVRNFGWDANNKLWRRVLTDTDGRMLVSTSVTQGSSSNQPQINVGTSTVQLLGINNSRRLVMIQNLGAVPIYIGFGVPATVAGGFQIAAGGTFIDDHFLGAINAIAPSGTADTRIVEF